MSYDFKSAVGLRDAEIAEVERLRQEAANYKHALFSAVENVHKPQMAHAEAEIERLRTEIEHLIYEKGCIILGLKERNAELLAALQFYASKESYIGHGMQDAIIFHDWGSIARTAIKKAEGHG